MPMTRVWAAAGVVSLAVASVEGNIMQTSPVSRQYIHGSAFKGT